MNEPIIMEDPAPAGMQAIIEAAVAAALMAMGRAPGGALATPFARTPAQASTGVINYNKSEGMKIFTDATAPTSPKYTGNTIDMHIFLKNVKAGQE